MDNFWAKLRGNTTSRYIGTAEFDFRSDFEMADGDPSKYELKDSVGNINANEWHKVFDEEIDLFDNVENDIENRKILGEISVIIKIEWKDLKYLDPNYPKS